MSKLFVQKYTIPNEKCEKSIVLLTDIHYVNQKEQKVLLQILEVLKKMEYDYLCISGDFLDTSEVKEDFLLSYVESLAKLSKVIIGIGNHELTNSRKKAIYSFPQSFYQRLRKIKNVKVLDNETYVDGSIRFIGVTLPLDYYYRYHENLSYFIRYMNLKYPTPYEDKYNILLCHTPLPFQKKEVFTKVPFLENISLILTGHFHGGLTPRCLYPVLKGRGLIGPFRKIFPKHAYGIFKRNSSYVIVSSGVTKISQVQKIAFLDSCFAKEITSIHLTKKK